MESLQGKLLLASGRLLDPNFNKTIVLIVRHDEDGAFGLIINRTLDVTVREACSSSTEGECQIEEKVRQGGPCDGPLMVLHTHKSHGEVVVVPGLYYSVEREQIEWLMENNHDAILFFAGYSGWGAGQLEEEMASGSWLVTPASKELVFSPDEQLWSKLMSLLTAGLINPKSIPDDPSMN